MEQEKKNEAREGERRTESFFFFCRSRLSSSLLAARPRHALTFFGLLSISFSCSRSPSSNLPRSPREKERARAPAPEAKKESDQSSRPNFNQTLKNPALLRLCPRRRPPELAPWRQDPLLPRRLARRRLWLRPAVPGRQARGAALDGPGRARPRPHGHGRGVLDRLYRRRRQGRRGHPRVVRRRQGHTSTRPTPSRSRRSS